MSHFIDRRVNSKNKSTVNRQRFLKRYKSQLKRAVSDAVNRRSITDIDGGERSVSRPKTSPSRCSTTAPAAAVT
jgi:uncharacterized sporulation protein YeaH/YhbH (DUF444 family)